MSSSIIITCEGTLRMCKQGVYLSEAQNPIPPRPLDTLYSVHVYTVQCTVFLHTPAENTKMTDYIQFINSDKRLPQSPWGLKRNPVGVDSG